MKATWGAPVMVSATGMNAMPAIGLGTMRNRGPDARALVEQALAVGYRHLDTAEAYGNEADVGEGLARSGVPREDVWLTTKFLHPKSPPPRDLHAVAESALKRLGVDYVDTMMVHWPHPDVPMTAALEALGRFRDEGKSRTIGVSNIPAAMLRESLRVCPDLAVVQVEYHAYLGQRAVRALAGEHGLVLTAHSPLALGKVLDDDVIREIASARGITPAQVALRWVVQHDGVTAIPGGSPGHGNHLAENIAVLDLELSAEEIARIDALERGLRVVDPPHAPAWDDRIL